jgi:sec-independent protein translocase protein TatA
MFDLLAFGIGFQEAMIILVAVLILFGGRKIPELMRGIGQGVGELQKGLDDGKRGIQKSLETSTTDDTTTK